MTRRTRTAAPLSKQVKRRSTRKVEKKPKYDGDFGQVISTGSTLLDLAISGGRARGGGLPGGVMVEIFGPPSIGKTSVLCEVAGAVQRKGGKTKFMDPEARLSTSYAKIFDLELDPNQIETPDTPLDVFPKIRKWKPGTEDVINGIFVDSTAALASDLELEQNKDGSDKKDEYGRRAKLFSQECRKTCRTLTKENYLMMFSNQLRQIPNAGAFGQQSDSTGGEALKFYSSIRLRARKNSPFQVKKDAKIRGREVSRVIGISIEVEVFKSSVWEPYHKAPVYILFDYGIDDIRANLIYVKQFGAKVKKSDGKDYTGYTVRGERLGTGLEVAIGVVEEYRYEEELREQVIELWEEVQANLQVKRKKKRR